MSGNRKQHWQRLRGIYRACFFDDKGQKLSPAGAAVIANLRDMSGFERSAKRADPHDTYYALGQQEVVKHILQIMNLTDEQIARLDQSVTSETELEVLGLSDDRHFN